MKLRLKSCLVAALLAGVGTAVAQSSHDAEPGAKSVPAAALPALESHPVVALTFDDLPGAGATAMEYITLGREEEQIALKHEIPNILLLHTTAFTTRMLPQLLTRLRRIGFTFASLSAVEKDHLGHTLDPDAALSYGGTLPDQYMDSRHLTYPAVTPKPFAKLKSLCR
jgi:hypothetical protein